MQVLEGVQQILESSRYADMEERSLLQEESDALVSAVEVEFHVRNVENSVRERAVGGLRVSLGYLELVVGRMNMDEQQDYGDEPN